MDSSADYARPVRARLSAPAASEFGPAYSLQYRRHAGSGAMEEQFGNTGGYGTTRSGDMAQRIEQQLDSVLGVSNQDGSASQLSVDGVQHYSHADLEGWIECMIDELQPSSQAQMHTPQQHSPTPTHSSFVSMESSLDSMDSQAHLAPRLPAAVMPDMYGDDFSNSMGGALCPPEENRLQSSDSGGVEESGVRLVHLLLACAEAIQRNDVTTAEDTVRRIQMLAKPQRGPMGKVATYFVEALARRIFGVSGAEPPTSDPLTELLHFHFYETCPYLKFAHFTANQAILEAVQNHKRIHVIDCNLLHGLQWPALIQALALRPGGPPYLRLTGIGPPHQSGNDVLQEIGMKLAQLAESVNVQFEFRGVTAQKLDDVKPWMLQVRQGEAVAVNAVMQLHRLLHNDNNSVPAVHEVLQSMRSLNPKIVTLVEHEANHNSPTFLDRFMEALHYYSTMFDSLEAYGAQAQSNEQLLAEMYVGREICNIVACEGSERVERHETLVQWRQRMRQAGFQLRHLGSNAFKQASMLLTLFPGDGYRVQENNGCLTLGWHNRPLVAASAWHCA